MYSTTINLNDQELAIKINKIIMEEDVDYYEIDWEVDEPYTPLTQEQITSIEDQLWAKLADGAFDSDD